MEWESERVGPELSVRMKEWESEDENEGEERFFKYSSRLAISFWRSGLVIPSYI
jgi:hypothetical protein